MATNGSNEKVGAMIFPTDEKAKVSSNDTTSGYLNGKIVAGTNITLTEQNNGANETLKIDANVPATQDEKVKVSANDTNSQYLGQKIQAGNEVTLNTLNPGANEKLEIVATAPVTSVNTQTGAVNLTAADVGAAATVHTHAASAIVSGTIDTARLGSGTANSTTFLRGDQTYATPPGPTGFTASQNTAAPNNTVNASRLLVDAATTDADAVIQAKGSGALLAILPDGTTTAGNKRGLFAVDLQRPRLSANQVASGNYAFQSGSSNRTSGTHGVTFGFQNTNTGAYSLSIGQSNDDSSWGSQYSAFLGQSHITDGRRVDYTYCFGTGAQSNDDYSIILAKLNSFGGGNRDFNYVTHLLHGITTNATPMTLAPQFTWGLHNAQGLEATIVAYRTDVANIESAAWTIRALVMNGVIAGGALIDNIGSALTVPGSWTVAINNSGITCTGETGKTIRWGITLKRTRISRF